MAAVVGVDAGVGAVVGVAGGEGEGEGVGEGVGEGEAVDAGAELIRPVVCWGAMNAPPPTVSITRPSPNEPTPIETR